MAAFFPAAYSRAGISRSAAVMLFVVTETGRSFRTRPFAELANRYVLETMNQVTILEQGRPCAQLR